MKILCWTYIKRVLAFLLLAVLLYVARNVGYLITEFVIRSNTHTMNWCKQLPNANINIPELIHQIYYPIKGPDLSSDHRSKIRTWIKFNPGFKHMLWNESAVIDLIRKDHPKLMSVYHSYGHWVQRIDLAKYVILYHYGGWYIDLDIKCKQSVGSLAGELHKANKNVVVHSEDTIGPATDFFGVTPRNTFIKFVLEGLPRSNKWFLLQHLTIMFSTGPSFLWGRYMNYPCQDNIRILSLQTFAKYARLSHDCSWWGQDTRFIYYALDHKLIMFSYFVAIVLILIVILKRKSVCKTLFKFRNKLHRNTKYI